MISEIYSYIGKQHPCFNSYSKSSQEKIVHEVFKRSQKKSIDEVHSFIKNMILSKKGVCVVPPIDHPIGEMFSSLLLTERNWSQKIPSKKEVFSFLPSVLWKTDPALSKAARDWIQAKIQHAPEEIPDSKMRSIYLRNLLSYYPFFSPEKGEEIRLPFGPLGSTVGYRVEPIQLTPSYLGSPLMAYGLIPKTKNASPLLLLKGTTYPADEGFYLSLLTDINPYRAVGGLAFQRFGKEPIQSFLAKHTKAGHKAEVMGASLGGCLSLQVASAYPHYLKAAHAFNSPGVALGDIATWEKNKEEKPEVRVYLQEGDPVSRLVGSHFASDWKIFHVFAPNVSIAQVHAATYTAHPESFIIPESAAAESQERRRAFWPFVQHILLLPLFLLGSGFLALRILAHKIYETILHTKKTAPK